MKRQGSGVSTLIVVEDNDEDFEALSRILRTLGVDVPIQRYLSGDECLAALGYGESASESGNAPLPGLILLDLNLPGMDGREALRAIKSDSRLKLIPVTILTTSSNQRDVQACYASGANAYVLKSLDYDNLVETVRNVTKFWLSTVILPA